jgi:hypothetical protein
MILRHFDGIVAWAQTRQTNGFIEAINGPVSSCQAQGARVRQLQNHAHCAVSHRRQARLLGLQSACLVSRITHCIFERARKPLCFFRSSSGCAGGSSAGASPAKRTLDARGVNRLVQSWLRQNAAICSPPDVGDARRHRAVMQLDDTRGGGTTMRRSISRRCESSSTI